MSPHIFHLAKEKSITEGSTWELGPLSRDVCVNQLEARQDEIATVDETDLLALYIQRRSEKIKETNDMEPHTSPA